MKQLIRVLVVQLAPWSQVAEMAQARLHPLVGMNNGGSGHSELRRKIRVKVGGNKEWTCFINFIN